MKSSLPRVVLQNVSKRYFHTTRRTSLFYEFSDKDGYLKKTKEEKEWKKLSKMQKLAIEFQLCKEAIKETAKYVKDYVVQGPRLFNREHELDVVFKFTGNPKELKEWVVNTDRDHELGYSTAELDFTPSSKGLFHGFLDTKVPQDGKLKRTGYCNVRMVPRLGPFKNKLQFEWTEYTHLVFRVRGDGRVYSVNIHSQKYSDVTTYDTYHYFIWTRGGPYWQDVRIPFSRFLFAYKGRIQAHNQIVPLDQIGAVSFTLADKITGPFRFEIDYIATEYDPSHTEETAYEQYFCDSKFW